MSVYIQTKVEEISAKIHLLYEHERKYQLMFITMVNPTQKSILSKTFRQLFSTRDAHPLTALKSSTRTKRQLTAPSIFKHPFLCQAEMFAQVNQPAAVPAPAPAPAPAPILSDNLESRQLVSRQTHPSSALFERGASGLYACTLL